MSAPDDPFQFDNGPEPDRIWTARDYQPPETGPEWEVNGHAIDQPIVNGGSHSLFDDPPPPGAPMVEHALDYARRGWPVFPCKPTNKAPFFEGGFHVATTDEKTIRKWWGYWPKAMIGVPMGPRSGVWAIDPDPPKKPEEPDGREIWASLIKEHGELPATHTEITPRGGYHIVFKWDPEPAGDQQPRRAGKDQHRCTRRRRLHHRGTVRLCRRWQPKNVAGQYCVPTAEFLPLRHGAGLALRSGA